MENIGLLDPSIDSRNGGDLIIREAVGDVLADLGYGPDSIISIPTQRPMSSAERARAATCNKFLVGGTNLLSSHLLRYRQWKLRPWDVPLFDQNVMLLGVGWWQYQGSPDRFTQKVYQRLLRPKGHSLRDGYSLGQLKLAGLHGVNTACPTMWRLPPRPERTTERGNTVVVTLTDYNRKADVDGELIRTLKRNYDKVSIWPQSLRDIGHVRRLDPEATVLEPTVSAFDAAVASGSDYVGTRLHAGIRALQHGARSTILAVDNRAREIARDTGLPVIDRDLSSAPDWLFGSREIELRLPRDEINAWLRETREWLRR